MKLVKIFYKIISSTLVMALVFSLSGGIQIASAAALTSKSDTLSSSKISTLSSHIIKFTTPTGATDSTDTIIVTFPSDFNLTSKTIGTITFTHGATTGLENSETLSASPSASNWGAVLSGTQNRILTLTAPSDGTGAAAVSAGNKIIITYDSTNSTNPTTPGNYSIVITGTFGDTGNITVPILSDDQVSVSATVDQSISFSISDNTIGFGTLSSSAARYATGDTTGSGSETGAHDLLVGTNAASGYTLALNGTTLSAGGPTIDSIGASNASSVTGTEQFGIRFTASGGTGAVSSPYAASGFAFDTASFPDSVASASGPSAVTTYSARYLSNIAVLTEAGSYSTSLTYTASANY
jgi:hypothetical protein